MNRHGIARWLGSLLASAAVAFSAMQPVRESAQSGAAGSTADGAAPQETLRVGMWTLWRDREVVLSPAGRGRGIALRSCAQYASLTFTQPVHVLAEGEGVKLAGAGKSGYAKCLWITGGVTLAAHGETVTIENPVTIAARAGVLTIIATLPVESYVERVVASESGASDSAESLKALAIVVRTFARHETHGHPDYDLCDSTHCQLLHWGGNGGRSAAAHVAALVTSGETLWFHGKRALGYFGKDCGGRTATPAEVWPHAKTMPYLPSQADRFCTADGGQDWASQISHADLTAALAARGLAEAGWQNLAVARRGESGRAVILRLDGKEIPAENFRLAVGERLGWNRVPSAWFEVSRQGDQFVFHGRGWGHGVGLCQKGAAAMAAQGHAATQILTQYFPGAERGDEASGRKWESFSGSGFILESLDASDAAFLPDLNRARAEASGRSGLNIPSPITVRAFASTAAFRAGTLAPGWVAAFTEGDWIGTQPLRVLAARRLLGSTMLHEFLHALVEHEASPHAPLWLREGLVEVWSEAQAPRSETATLELTPEEVDRALAHAASGAASEAAHHAAAIYAQEFLARYGRGQVIDWLRSGVPAGVAAGLRQR